MRADPSISPPAISCFMMAWMPPAKYTSSRWCSPPGASEQMCGTRPAISLMRSSGKGRPASVAMAARCSTVLVEQPMAASRARAFSTAVWVTMSRGSQVFCQHPHHRLAAVFGQPQPLRVRRRHGAVARQSQAEHLGEAVHAVGGEQAGARSARRAGGALELLETFVVQGAGHVLAHGLEDAVQVQRAAAEAPGQHGAAADDHGGDVETHGGHQHAGHDLVAARAPARARRRHARWPWTRRCRR